MQIKYKIQENEVKRKKSESLHKRTTEIYPFFGHTLHWWPWKWHGMRSCVKRRWRDRYGSSEYMGKYREREILCMEQGRGF